MQTVPQPRLAAIPNKPLAEIGSAQHTALMRWWIGAPISQVVDAIEANPTFPLVPCNAQAQPFAPSRGTPRPAA